MRRRLIWLMFVVAIAIALSIQAQAQILCSSIYARHSQVATSHKLEIFGESLQSLRDRLMQEATIHPERVLETLLATQEKDILMDGSHQTLLEMKGKIRSLIAVSKKELVQNLETLQAEEARLLRKNPTSLRDVLFFSFQTVDLANSLVLAKTHRMTSFDRLKDPSDWQSWNDYEELYRFIVLKRKLVPVPTNRNLSIRDLNDAQAHSLALVGLITETSMADQILRFPRNFYGHDINHAKQGTTFFTPEIWKQLFHEISNWPEIEQAAAHALIFDMTHENTGLMYEFRAQDFANATGYRLVYRLQHEDFYGEPTLSQAPNLAALLAHIGQKIDQTIHRLNPEGIGIKSIPPYLQ